jgi:DNA-binding MurR/RpiR family transcriptional regulator
MQNSDKQNSGFNAVDPLSSDIEYLCRIRSNYHSLTKIEKKIARYILNHQNEVLYNSITLFAKKIGTSAPTITRFCQSLGFKGFSEFKFYMEKDLLSPFSKSEEIDLNDSIKIVKQKILHFNKEIIDDTIMLLNEHQLEKTISAISNANMVHFYGEGGTSSTAFFAYNLFLQIGIPCNAFNDGILALMAAPHLKKGDVAISITYSGSAVNPMDALKLAKEHGATTISITGNPSSPITKFSDIVLCSSSKIKDDIRFLHAARICELVIIGLMQIGVLNSNYEKLSSNIVHSKEAIKLRRLKQKENE